MRRLKKKAIPKLFAGLSCKDRCREKSGTVQQGAKIGRSDRALVEALKDCSDSCGNHCQGNQTRFVFLGSADGIHDDHGEYEGNGKYEDVLNAKKNSDWPFRPVVNAIDEPGRLFSHILVSLMFVPKVLRERR